MSSVMRQALRAGSAWTPRRLFRNGEFGAWLDINDWSTLFQDNVGLVPVTELDQPVKLIKDKSGNSYNFTAATDGSRPVLKRSANGSCYLQFSTTGAMTANSVNLSSYSSVFAGGVWLLPSTGTSVVFGHSPSTATRWLGAACSGSSDGFRKPGTYLGSAGVLTNDTDAYWLGKPAWSLNSLNRVSGEISIRTPLSKTSSTVAPTSFGTAITTGLTGSANRQFYGGFFVMQSQTQATEDAAARYLQRILVRAA